jgi:hypothetical protein
MNASGLLFNLILGDGLFVQCARIGFVTVEGHMLSIDTVTRNERTRIVQLPLVQHSQQLGHLKLTSESAGS